MGLLYCLLFLLMIAISPFTVAQATSSNRISTATSSIQQNTISLHFANIEVSALLHELARLGDTNFLLSEAIQGRMSVGLKKYSMAYRLALHFGQQGFGHHSPR